jgi:predicted TIM-barrel fold metal-dependent hydrolase
LPGQAASGESDIARIDVHHHAMQEATRAWLVEHGLLPPVGGPPHVARSPTQRLATMDAHGIEFALVSPAIPGTLVPSSPGEAAAMARVANDTVAELARDRPDRFGFFAYLPLPHVDASLAELDHAFTDLGADGVILMSHVGEIYLGDPALDSVMAALNDRAAVVLTHPFDLPGVVRPPIPTFLVDFMADTARGAVQMIRNGVLDRYPKISIILPHGGGTLPYQAARLSLGQGLGYGVDPETVRRTIGSFYYDTAGPMSPYATPTLLAAAGAKRIVYGSDYPVVPDATVGAGVRVLLDDPALNADALRRICLGNALSLFPAVGRRLRRGAVVDGVPPFAGAVEGAGNGH